MQVKPVAGPHAVNPGSQNDYAKAQAMRANAIKAFSGQPAQQVVENQSQVSPEELGAIKAPQTKQNSTVVEDSPEIPTPNVDTKAENQPEDPTLSRRFAQLAKQERILRQKALQQEQALKAREEALKAKEEAYTSKDQEYAQKYIQKDFLKNNPLQALAEAEVSYDDLTQQILNSSQPQDPRMLATLRKMEEKIQQLEKAAEEGTKSQKTAQAEQYQAAIKQIRADVNSLVETDPEFETIKATKSHKDVVDLIVQTYEEDGTLLSVEEAAKEVENYILEEALKLSQLSKVAKRREAAVSASKTSQQPVATQTTQSKVQTQPGMKTLTNAAASTRQLSARERALLAFKGELK